jgi:hypothetical protein
MAGQTSKKSTNLSFERIAIFLTAFIMVLLLLFAMGVSLQSSEYNAKKSILWETAKEDPVIPKDDLDNDGLPDIEENYDFGTNIYDKDSDGDGMWDLWEVQWNAIDPLTEQRIINPVDPNDAYQDPDNDGYDYNRNGYIDRFDDSVVKSELNIPADVDYDEKNIKRLIQSPVLYQDTLIRLSGVYVMDNGSYAFGGGEDVTKQITIQLAEETSDISRDFLRVVLQPNANRPVMLKAYNQTSTGQPIPGDRVDVQGVFRVVGTAYWLEVRGGEEFTNIMEYKARFYIGDPEVREIEREYNQTDPTNPDTDGDGMLDGWEDQYGLRLLDEETGDLEWIVKIDPTSDDDAYLDPDGDVVETRWALVPWLYVDPDGDGVYEPPGGATPNDPVSVGYNIHEFIRNTNPIEADTDNDSYPIGAGTTNDFDEIIFHGTNPTKEDTDGDEMWDGWEIYYQLQANNASDRFGDEDNDRLVNYQEFLQDTNPHKNDTDEDLMWDGWEVEYGLQPKNPNDANGDPDEDLLFNWQEFFNSTNPRDPDSDRDFLTDYEEIVTGWTVTVDGQVSEYHTDPNNPDSDQDDEYDDQDGDGNFDPNEEILDGIDNDLDSAVLQNNGIDDDHDGVVDDGRPGIPAVGLPEGVDEEQDFNDYNEIFIYHTNASNPDSDGEGLDDWYEWFTDVDDETVGIQRTQPTLSDTDADGLDDKEEGEIWIWLPGYTDKVKRHTNPLMPDTDSDGLSDGDEVLVDYDPRSKEFINSTDPEAPDTDGDGMLDGFEFDYSDIDGDGLATWWERENAGIFQLAEFRRDTDINGVNDTQDDWDGDGLTNLDEYIWRFDPWNYDTDGDNIIDSKENKTGLPRAPVYYDSDGDLMPDWWEDLKGLQPFNPTDKWADPDHDFLVNIDEYIFNLEPFNADTDGDGEADLLDHEIMSNPDSYDSDEDGIADWWERLYSDILDYTNPEDADRNDDGDNWTNYEEYIFVDDPYNHIPTDPTKTSTDGDKFADDNDPFPVFIPTTQRPMNPTRKVQSLNPLRALDRYGNPESEGDMDRDLLNNSAEFARDVSHTNPTDPDTDGDGMPDGWEVVHALWDPFTAKPNLSPLDPTDAYDDPDWDGINYSLKRDSQGNYIISEGDYNGDGYIDPVTENETFCNLEEYLYGEDLNRDGIIDRSPHPNKWDTDEDGISDGWEALLNDNDADNLSNWYELVYGLNPFDPEGVNGTYGDPDEDGFSNYQEFLNNTNPRDPTHNPDTVEKGMPPMPLKYLNEATDSRWD